MDPRLIPYAERPAPRYTSYPTAPHFHAGVNDDTYARWLTELTPETKLSLYLHVPYCREICAYCGCNTFASRADGPILDYAQLLTREIEHAAALTPAKQITSIAWGGGTPNILPPGTFLALVERLKQRFDFSTLVEHGVEVDPRLLTGQHAEAFANAGVTRASLGVQDLNPHVQEAIGRVQPEAIVQRAINMLRAEGIGELNIDLMYGLPHQSIEDARHSAETAASWKPNRVTVFGYAHVPWFKARQRLIDESALPGTEARFDQAEAVRETLEALGYVAIGFDHFARPDDPLAIAAQNGELTRSFQGYAQDDCDALIGFGASAISTLPQGYAQNAPQVSLYSAAIGQGDFATVRGVETSAEDKARRDIINRLLCDFTIDLDAFGSVDAFAAALAHLQPLIADGLATRDGARISVTKLGRPFARLIAEAFDTYRPQSEARHSRAV